MSATLLVSNSNPRSVDDRCLLRLIYGLPQEMVGCDKSMHLWPDCDLSVLFTSINERRCVWMSHWLPYKLQTCSHSIKIIKLEKVVKGD